MKTIDDLLYITTNPSKKLKSNSESVSESLVTWGIFSKEGKQLVNGCCPLNIFKIPIINNNQSGTYNLIFNYKGNTKILKNFIVIGGTSNQVINLIQLFNEEKYEEEKM